MKRLFVFLSVLLLLAATAFSQSGRRIKKPKPTPKPVVVSENSYSESRSYQPRRIFPKNYHLKKKKDAVPVPEKKEPELDEDGEEVIEVDSSLVKIPVSVYNRNGLYVPNIQESEVKVFEDGKEQEIAYFSTSDQPFTVALLIDTSPSTAYKIREIRDAAKAFVRQLKPDDAVIVIEFDGNAQVLSKATTNRSKTYKAIDRADFGGGTALYDAVHIAINRQLKKIEGRKAIVLFTDGVDTTSRRSYYSTITDAEEFDATIFPIQYNTFLGGNSGGGIGGINGGVIPPIRNQGRGTSAEEYRRGAAYLEDLARSTGGRVFKPESTPGGLSRAFVAIAQELRQQYNLGYYPSETGEFGTRKKIKVRIYRPKLIVRARSSYIVGVTEGTK